MRILIISGITQTGRQSAQTLADDVETAFVEAAFVEAALPSPPSVVKLIFGSASKIKDLMNSEMNEASKTGECLVVVYFGHGDQRRGRGQRKPEEADGKDEFWCPAGGGSVLDDEITSILVSRRREPAPPPFVLLISDSCSSGTMIDAPLADPSRKWASIGACTDSQSAFASFEGGAFTMWGLIPALKAGCKTAGQISRFATREMSISTQTVMTSGNTEVDIFASDLSSGR